jgi:hypothetical protein
MRGPRLGGRGLSQVPALKRAGARGILINKMFGAPLGGTTIFDQLRRVRPLDRPYRNV